MHDSSAPHSGPSEASPSTRAARGYIPIEDYAAIGDCHGSALVSRDGTVDWCCLERFDADPVFCRLLDAGTGGFFSLRPAEAFTATRAYVGDTNVLSTTFETAGGGRVTITDFMPVGRHPRAGVHDYVDLAAPHWLVRIVENAGTRTALDLAFRPSVAFGVAPAPLTRSRDGVGVDQGVTLYGAGQLSIVGDLAWAPVQVGAGERSAFVVAPHPLARPPDIHEILALRDVTLAFWQEWIGYCRYRGPYEPAVHRSALALKLMTYAPSGALVAALTTSLPEEIGGERNWDYRYTWLRDSQYTLYALGVLGYAGEARRYFDFLKRCIDEAMPDLQIMYAVEGERDLTEHTLDHLSGYRDSRPVRVGNGAFRQRQIDIYGALLDGALMFRTLGGRFEPQDEWRLRQCVDFVAAHWRTPDQSLWEMRGEPRHFVHGKAMSWVALDRALRLFGPNQDWAAARDAILTSIIDDGVHPEGGHLLQSYAHPGTDAALLTLPMLGLPLERRLLERTVGAVEAELRHGDFVHRYKGDDGLSGGEGAFLLCSFWLVDALLAVDRADEARALFERLLDAANDVGLFAEEVDVETGGALGNFPQAFTHLGLIISASHLALYEKGGAAALSGSHADRAARGVMATVGWRGLWAAYRQTGMLSRLTSSSKSKMRPRNA